MRNTTAMKLCLAFALSVATLAGTHALPSTAAAQQVQVTGPLAGAPACRHCRIYREGRFSIAPSAAITVQNEFVRTFFFGGTATYHIFDWLGVGVYGAYGAVGLETDLADEVTRQGIATDRNRLSLPSAGGFPDQIGRMTWLAAPQLTFIPLRGKLALFQRVFVDTDFYFNLGVAFVGVEERADTAADICDSDTDECLETQSLRSSRVAIAATFGFGLSLYFNDTVSLQIEWRGLPFKWNTSGFDNAGDPRGTFPDGLINSDDRQRHFNHMVQLGVGIFFPTRADVSE